jgi:HD-like signal output (HDOD) protein
MSNKQMSGKRKPYFDNNWQEYKDAPDELFVPHTFEEVMSWKVGGWEFPSSVCCVIRATNLETRKVKEYVYRKQSAAQNKVNELIEAENVEFIVADHESIHFISPVHD